VRNFLELEAFLGKVGQQREDAAAMVAQVGGEGGQPRRVGGEFVLRFHGAAADAAGDEVGGGEEKDAALRHRGLRT
jgi:hypothetical protein